MIKCISEKQDEIIRHMKEFSADLVILSKETKEEFIFYKSIFSQFSRLQSEFSKSISSFINFFISKSSKMITSNSAQKRLTSSKISKIAFESMKEFFESFYQKFLSITSSKFDDIFQNFEDFQNNSLAELNESSIYLQKCISNIELVRRQANDSKMIYFDFVYGLSEEEKFVLNSLGKGKDKNKKRLDALESNYFTKTSILNIEYSNLKSTYQETVRTFNRVFAAKSYMISDKLRSYLKLSKLQDDDNNFQLNPSFLNFLDFSKQIWLQNFEKLYDSYITYHQVISFREKIEDSSIQKITKAINSIQKITPEEFINRARLLCFILILDFSIVDSKIEILEFFKTSDIKFLNLIFLKLKLLIHYEGGALFISIENMKFFKSLIEIGLEYFDEENLTDSTIYFFENLLSVAMKTYSTNRKKDSSLDRSTSPSIESSLLFALKQLRIFHIRNFWQKYFESKFTKPLSNENSVRHKHAYSAGKLLLINLFIHSNASDAQTFVESVIPNSSINIKVVRNAIVQKLAYRIHSYPIPPRTYLPILNKNDKVIVVFELIVKLGFTSSSNVLLNRKISDLVLKTHLNRLLMTRSLSHSARVNLWKILCKQKASLSSSKLELSSEMIDLIRLDVARTKKFENQQQKQRLESLILNFFKTSSEPLIYFQGFNYIASFALDVLDDEKETMNLLRYLQKNLISDFLGEKICYKINLLHFQLNYLIKNYFPKLWRKWKVCEMNSEVLFGSPLISLFSSFTLSDKMIIPEIWDIIFVEGWSGLLKCILYMIEMNLSELYKVNITELVRFFSESELEKNLVRKFSSEDLKSFAERIKIEVKLLEFLELEYRKIQEMCFRLKCPSHCILNDEK